MGARNRGGRGLSYQPARQHRLAEFIPWVDSRASYTFKNTGSGQLFSLADTQQLPPFPPHLDSYTLIYDGAIGQLR
jgi:hypothetical protein